MAGSQSGSTDLPSLVALYAIEANLVQAKAGHILTIRSITMATFTGILAAAAIYPGRGIQALTLVLIPFYLLDSVYDGYLIPIVRRETELRHLLGHELIGRGSPGTLGSSFLSDLDHRQAPAQWSPFWRAALEPLRILFYGALIVIPPLVIELSPLL